MSLEITQCLQEHGNLLVSTVRSTVRSTAGMRSDLGQLWLESPVTHGTVTRESLKISGNFIHRQEEMEQHYMSVCFK